MQVCGLLSTASPRYLIVLSTLTCAAVGFQGPTFATIDGLTCSRVRSPSSRFDIVLTLRHAE